MFRMKNVLHRFIEMFLLVCFLTGTTGVSFYIHTCSSANKRDVYAFPEIKKPAGSCCCDNEIHHGTSCNDHLVFDAVPCCTQQYLYFKAAFLSLVPCDHFVQFETVTPVAATLLPVQNPELSPNVTYCRFLTGKSPPLSGRDLVFFLHQIRIPSPASLS